MPGLIYCHGYATTNREPLANAASDAIAMWKLIARIAEDRPVLSCDFGLDAWGNASAVSKVTSAVAHLRATYGVHPSKVFLFGQSMGHLTAMNWAAQNKAQVAGVIGSMGVADLKHIHDLTNPEGGYLYRASIDAAYTNGYTDAQYGAAHNPIVNAGTKYAGMPWLDLYGTGDTVASPARAEALKTAIGSTARTIPVAGTHNWPTIDNYPVDEVLGFLNDNS
ncbi:hypothetical protein O1W71_16265 [Microbacterium sp. H37-C3]|nr:hypothetical protein [Microbacterium sp. H37-C3]